MTKNKIEILEIIRNSDKHLSAEEIYFMVKSKNPSVSLSTVYRNLGLLVDEGYIKKYDIDSEGKCIYDKRVYDHAHAVNDETNEIIDIIDDNLIKTLGSYVDGDITSYNLVIHFSKKSQ